MKSSYFGSLHHHFLRFGLQQLAGAGGSVLDMGCGGGAFSRLLKKMRPDLLIYGGDVNRASLSRARQGFKGTEFVYADIYNIPFSSNSFDAVIILDLLEHLDSPGDALEEVRRVLKPNGILYLSVPLEGDRSNLVGLLYYVFNLNLKSRTGHLQLFTRQQIFYLLQGSGFSIKSYWHIFHFFYQLVYLVYLWLPWRFIVLKESSGRQESRYPWWLTVFSCLVNLESYLFSWWPGQTILIAASRVG